MHKTTTDVNIVAEVTKEALEDTDEPTNLKPDQLRIGIPQEPIVSSYIFLELITLEILRSLSASSYILPQV